MAQKHRVRIPATITAGPFEFSVHLQSSLRNGDNEPLLGQCDYKQTTIAIDPTASASQQEETFVHELLHAICYGFDVWLEEEQVVRLSKGLTTLFNTHGWPDTWVDRRSKR